MTFLRSSLFAAVFFPATAVMAILALPLLLASPATVRAVGRNWGRMMIVVLRSTVGLRHEIRGSLPPAGTIVAAKHQSAWETMALAAILPDPTYVIKDALLKVPVIGWYFARAGQIAIDRASGAGALRAVVRAGSAVLAEGRHLVIFPQGTRVPPGERRPYLPGVAALYRETGTAVVPVALNSGCYWGRRAFTKRSGTIIIAFLEPIAPGLDRRSFLRLVEERTERACRELEAEAGARPS